MTAAYLGYRDADRASEVAAFYDPVMAPLPRHVLDALGHGPQPAPLFTPLAEAGRLLDDGEETTENGFAVAADGSFVVAVRTPMPAVSPAMWDWWFGWHGCDERRYKLWHPRAHLRATWTDGEDGPRRGRARYVGRTSVVEEYLGSELVRGAIRFVAPGELGLDESRLADPALATAICARIGVPDRPLDIGTLVHHVRAVPGGAEMRSRFWMGGAHVVVRGAPAGAARAVRPLVARQLGDPVARARALLVHCAQEMQHLAARLPALHERFGD